MSADLTPDQQARRAKSLERYDRIYSEVVAERRAAWAEEFGTDCPLFRFRPKHSDLHRETQRRVELEQRHDAEEAADALR